MRIGTLLIVVVSFGWLVTTPALAMGSGPHPTVPYGIPVTPKHTTPVIAEATPPASLWDHQIYQIAAVIAAGELLLAGLMLSLRRKQSPNES